MGKKSEIGKNLKRRARNKLVKADIKECAREIRKSGRQKDHPGAEKKLGDVLPKLDRAARKGVLHKNNAARKKSRLFKRVNGLKKTAQAG